MAGRAATNEGTRGTELCAERLLDAAHSVRQHLWQHAHAQLAAQHVRARLQLQRRNAGVCAMRVASLVVDVCLDCSVVTRVLQHEALALSGDPSVPAAHLALEAHNLQARLQRTYATIDTARMDYLALDSI